jgi:hypothetical protein
MTCDHCVNGLRPLEWTDAKPGDPPEFAVCLCDAGQAYRRGVNNGRSAMPLWRVWCAQHRVDPSRVRLMEDVWTAEELAAVGLRNGPAPMSRAAALLAAGERRK